MQMQTFIWKELDRAQILEALARPRIETSAIRKTVQDILDRVQSEGDEALIDLTKKFDGTSLDVLRVENTWIESSINTCPPDLMQAMKRAKTNIEAFHAGQCPEHLSIETEPGLICERLPRPIETVGLYIPGGSAPLLSTVLMVAVPAMIAGVERLIMTTPPGPDGKINQVILAAAALCGVREIYAVGGAQAIGALAYGTEQIPRVDKIFGPGNQWVTMAKQLVSQEPGGPAIDMPAGPSEVMILVDADADPVFVAADLLAQAEHDPLAQVMLISLDDDVIRSIETELIRQLTVLPRRKIAGASLKNARAIIVTDRREASNIINHYAPEHLIVQTADPRSILPLIRNTGSVFLGGWTPEALGDYASGTNHVLPTFGAARAYSGLSVESFMKYITVQTCSKDALKQIGPSVELMAAAEGLDAHKRSVSIRLGRP